MSKIIKRHNARMSGVPQFNHDLGEQEEDDRPALTTAQRQAAGLADARIALPLQATIVDQRTGKKMPYRADSICPKLHNDVLYYFGEGPRSSDGYMKWLLAVGPRQSGKSAASSLCVDNICAQLEAMTGLIIADHIDRSRTLFNYIALSHLNRPRRLKPETTPNRESNQITYDHPGGVSKVRCLSAQSKNVGIGRAPDVAQISECPFIPGFDSFWTGFFPSMVNRMNARLVVESTPAPMTEPSAETFKNMVTSARKGNGRWLFSFTAFYETTLNERPWHPSWTLDSEELKLLAMFGPGGAHSQIAGRYGDCSPNAPGEVRYLTLQNLAFRRMAIADVPEIRRWPDLFFVWYPTDPVSCWTMKGGGVIPSDVLAKHQARIMVPWGAHETYRVYRKPQAGASYVIAVDPAGYGHDHASFQVLEVWRDKVYQAACYACPDVTPNQFSDKIIEVAKEYNQALVGVERNGVGLAVLAILERALERGEIQNLYYDTRGVRAKPGWHASKTSIEESLGALIDELQERLVLYDEETVAQLADYRNDKVTKLADARELLQPGDIGKGRRTKGHYDRASALALGCLLLRHVRAARRPGHVGASSDKPEEVVAKTGPLNWNEREELRKGLEQLEARRAALDKRRANQKRRRGPRKRRR